MAAGRTWSVRWVLGGRNGEAGLEVSGVDERGDAPGMNSAVRAVARTAFFEGREGMGVNAGYRGVLEGRI